jgi:hypothetical protein
MGVKSVLDSAGAPARETGAYANAEINKISGLDLF